MSKMSQLHAVLTQDAARLGFESIDEAERAGYVINYQTSRLDPPVEPSVEMVMAAREMEQAHKAWLEEKEHKLHTLRLTAELCRLSDMPNTADDLEAIADFFEKGEC